MIRIEQYTPVRQAAWDDLIDHSKSPMFMFKRGFMEYHADRFQDFSLLFSMKKTSCWPFCRLPGTATRCALTAG